MSSSFFVFYIFSIAFKKVPYSQLAACFGEIGVLKHSLISRRVGAIQLVSTSYGIRLILNSIDASSL